MKFKNRLILWSGVLTTSLASLAVSSVLYHKYGSKNLTNKDLLIENGSDHKTIMNFETRISLDSFIFSVDPKQVELLKNDYAGNYVTDTDLIFKNKATAQDMFNYWRNMLFISDIGTEGVKLFNLRTVNLTPINVLKQDYTFSFTSYANDLKGELILKMTVTNKNDSKDQKVQYYVLDGFKKLESKQPFASYIAQNPTIVINLNGFGESKTLNVGEFLDSFSLKSTDEKVQILKKIFTFKGTANDGVSVPVKYEDLQLDNANNSLKVKYDVLSNIYAATTDNNNAKVQMNLGSQKILDVDNEIVKKIYSLSDQIKFKPKDKYQTWSDIEYGKLKVNTSNFIEYNTVDTNWNSLEKDGYRLEVKTININDKEQNVEFNYRISKNEAALYVYDGKFKVPVSEFKEFQSNNSSNSSES
ncbi:hypothetical protein C4M97_01850 [Mycoplasmopsis pullorum]|uniref:MAG1430 family protein n=1 Tax=Mycoplasmopsis pullorum TaxID=48003 RepID=UPI00111B195B|nr:hypothetical protein [Mycoplasmopsis pullorum]TNK82617.1 hypothetical protein C4M94_00345 [Mycoplasmopsis pullorum]TNK83516.1 hypothetical protein C4M80_00170 [Mycoplasmopsis pullorum]TNK84926.1 hypothetical protein C4M81_00770 [Mycoplasmopsis pullorum]TNK85718.1 hypothetical protein C4M92_00295 [Mycoplasmopsis pullorum]TNK86259.1 hypothetical protein C4M85_00465 [Mycoplasmopsis pullorum]